MTAHHLAHLVGRREKGWGKKRKLRDEKTEQRLDDLSFSLIETTNKLRPKFLIMENVVSILYGTAMEYCKEIYSRLADIGYKTTHFVAKGEEMGVPQKRHRVFFVSTRTDADVWSIDFSFNYEPVRYGEIKEGVGNEISDKTRLLMEEARQEENYLDKAHKRLFGKSSLFTHAIVRKDSIVPTITARHAQMYSYPEMKKLSNEDYRNASTFPSDFDFCGQSVEYICGMSVPPIMMKRIVNRMLESGVFQFDRETNREN